MGSTRAVLPWRGHVQCLHQDQAGAGVGGEAGGGASCSQAQCGEGRKIFEEWLIKNIWIFRFQENIYRTQVWRNILSINICLT